MALTKAKKIWHRFQDSEPGSRFQEYYRRRQAKGHGWLSPRRLFNVTVGLLLVVVSAFFGWAPGPGMLTFFIGLGMIAGEFRPVARFLDWAEVLTRRLIAWIRATWNSSLVGKVLLVATALALVAASGYVVYLLFFG